MKMKSLIVLLLAGIWGVGSWWWYTCKVKGFCGAEHVASQTVTDTNNSNETQAKADAEKAAAKAQAKADAEKAVAEAQAKADAEKTAAEAQAKADAEKAAAEAQAKVDAAAGKITLETNEAAPDTGTGIDPALLHFPTGGAKPELADTTKTYFEKVTTFLKENASGTVSIVGHTDSQGDASKNKSLGMKRADSIKQILIDMGAPAERISASSEGEDKPLADNKTQEGREKNRRVEITPAK